MIQRMTTRRTFLFAGGAALAAPGLVRAKPGELRSLIRGMPQLHSLQIARGADVVFDHVGEPNWDCDLASLAKGGRLVFCGTTGGAEVSVNLSSVYFLGQSILGSTMGRRDELEQILALMAEGGLKPVIDRVFPLAELAEAHRYLEAGEQTGKIIIDIGS